MQAFLEVLDSLDVPFRTWLKKFPVGSSERSLGTSTIEIWILKVPLLNPISHSLIRCREILSHVVAISPDSWRIHLQHMHWLEHSGSGKQLTENFLSLGEGGGGGTCYLFKVNVGCTVNTTVAVMLHTGLEGALPHMHVDECNKQLFIGYLVVALFPTTFPNMSWRCEKYMRECVCVCKLSAKTLARSDSLLFTSTTNVPCEEDKPQWSDVRTHWASGWCHVEGACIMFVLHIISAENTHSS